MCQNKTSKAITLMRSGHNHEAKVQYHLQRATRKSATLNQPIKPHSCFNTAVKTEYMNAS